MDHEMLQRRRDAGELLCRLAKERQEAKDISFREAFHHVRIERPELYHQYLGRPDLDRRTR